MTPELDAFPGLSPGTRAWTPPSQHLVTPHSTLLNPAPQYHLFFGQLVICVEAREASVEASTASSEASMEASTEAVEASMEK